VNVMMIKDEGRGDSHSVGQRGRSTSAKANLRHRDTFIYEASRPAARRHLGQGIRLREPTSEVSKAIPVVTLGCPADLPQITASSSTEFRWNTVVGAGRIRRVLRRVRACRTHRQYERRELICGLGNREPTSGSWKRSFPIVER